MRKTFTMTEDQFKKILDASKPVPAMFLSGGQPMFGNQQDNANNAWAVLGQELGFDHMSVKPGDSKYQFSAEVKQERIQNETD